MESGMLSPFIRFISRDGEHSFSEKINLCPFRLQSNVLKHESELSPNDAVAVVSASALVQACLRHGMNGLVNGHRCKLLAAEALDEDDVVSDAILLSPVLCNAVCETGVLPESVSLCRESFTAYPESQHKSFLTKVVAGVISPVQLSSEEVKDYSDMAKEALFGKEIWKGSVLTISSALWIAIEVVEGSGPVSEETAFALRVTGPHPKVAATSHMRQWAKAHWFSEPFAFAATYVDELEVFLSSSNGIIALEGLPRDLEYILKIFCLGRASLDIDGHASTKEFTEAFAKLSLIGNESVLVLKAEEGIGEDVSSALEKAAYHEDAAGYMDMHSEFSTSMHFPKIVILCAELQGLSRNVLRHVYQEVKVPPATTDERRQIIKDTIEATLSNFAANSMQNALTGTRTRGSNSDYLQDIEGLVRSTVGLGRVEIKGLGNVYIENGMAGALKSLKLFGKGQLTISAGDVAWEDVGGLENAKKQITEVIEHSSSKRQRQGARGKRSIRTGILLHGPPGTGKTLLARAAANECNWSFLSVKGPELLDMYVGESERNVREVFRKAIASSPCVIFFDELDALAPARGRGSDSGGVSDRVVSQLMGEIDNVSNEGDILVVGASNRPDLVDASLLRPGRFDKLVYVPMPGTRQEQEVILRAQTRKFRFSETIDFQKVLSFAPQPPALSGADIYSLACNAWLRAVKREIAKDEGCASERDNSAKSISDFAEREKRWRELDLALEQWPARHLPRSAVDYEHQGSSGANSDEGVLVSMEDMIRAAENLIPSLSEAQMLDYESVKASLQGR